MADVRALDLSSDHKKYYMCKSLTEIRAAVISTEAGKTLNTIFRFLFIFQGQNLFNPKPDQHENT
jgi:hypothetical protein